MVKGRRREFGECTEPGDYAISEGDLHFVLPNSDPGSLRLGMIRGQNSRWSIAEHEDRTVTVSPSIWYLGENGWHGFLERGVWREV